MEGNVESQLRTTIKDAAKISATTPLSGVVEAFEGLAMFLHSHQSKELRLDTFCDACSLVSVLFGCLGLAFKFAEMEYVAKVKTFSPYCCVSGFICPPLYASLSSLLRPLSFHASKRFCRNAAGDHNFPKN